MNRYSSFPLAILHMVGFSRWLRGKESTCMGSIPGLGRFPWRRKWQPIPVFFPGKSHGQRSLVGYSPWGLKRVRHDWATKQQSVCMSVPLSQFIPPSPSPLCPYIQSLHLCLSIPALRIGSSVPHTHTHTHTHTHCIITQPLKRNLAVCDDVNGLEGIMLSETSQTERKKYHMISHICGI